MWIGISLVISLMISLKILSAKSSLDIWIRIILFIFGIILFGIGANKVSKIDDKETKKKMNEDFKKEMIKDKKQIKSEDRRWICDKCEYKWESKKSFGEPSQCPKCKERYITKFSTTKGWEKEWIERLNDNPFS